MRMPPVTVKLATPAAGAVLRKVTSRMNRFARLAPELDEVDAVQRMRRIEQNAGAPLVIALQCAVRG